MKNKKGFTLIEILVVIVILASLTTGAVIGMVTIQKKSEEKSLNELYIQITQATDAYFAIYENINHELLNGLIEEKCTRIYTLQQEGLLDVNLINPVTEKRIPGNLCVKSSLDSNGIIKHEFSLENE